MLKIRGVTFCITVKIGDNEVVKKSAHTEIDDYKMRQIYKEFLGEIELLIFGSGKKIEKMDSRDILPIEIKIGNNSLDNYIQITLPYRVRDGIRSHIESSIAEDTSGSLPGFIEKAAVEILRTVMQIMISAEENINFAWQKSGKDAVTLAQNFAQEKKEITFS